MLSLRAVRRRKFCISAVFLVSFFTTLVNTRFQPGDTAPLDKVGEAQPQSLAEIPNQLEKPPSVYEPLQRTFATIELTKVADVELKDDPEAFFLAVLPINNTLYASYRTTLSSWETKVLELDELFAPLPETMRRVSNTEDARSIELNGVGWLIDNHFLQPRTMTRLDGRHRVVLDTSALGENFERGKNWSPFVYQSQLFFVYSLLPLRILKCELPSGNLHWVYGVEASHDSKISMMNLGGILKRGGTNGVVFDNFVYGVGRTTRYENINCSGVNHAHVAQHYPFLWRFHTSLLDSARVISNDGDIEFREIRHPFAHGVNDPASLFVHNSSLYVTVSSCSCACLPEFRRGNEWQHNSVFKVSLRE